MSYGMGGWCLRTQYEAGTFRPDVSSGPVIPSAMSVSVVPE